MSGENATHESGWTVDTLKQHYDQRFADVATAVQAALVSQEKAILKAETAADKRFELLNELREGVATKEQVEATEKLIDGLTSRLDKIDGKSTGVSASWGYLVAGISLLILVANFIFRG